MNCTIEAQDWAQLTTFKQANEELLQSENSGDRIVFMGNSITAGWLDHYPALPFSFRGIHTATAPALSPGDGSDKLFIRAPGPLLSCRRECDFPYLTGYP